MGRGDDLVTVSGLVLIKETDKALGVSVVDEMEEHAKNAVQAWLPLSLIDARRGLDAYGICGEVDIPRWLAEKNNLEYEE
jgi:hypothetical protein